MSIRTWISSHRRAVTGSASVLLGLGLVVGGVAFAQPAAAVSLFGTCDANEALPLVDDPATNSTDIPFRVETLDGVSVATMGASTDTSSDDYLTSGQSVPDVTIPNADQTSPTTQLAGAGLRWWTFAQDCTSGLSGVSAQSIIGNFILNCVVVWPVRLLGLLLKFAYSTGISDMLLLGATAATKALTANVWAKWVPFAIFATLVAAAIRLARGRGRQAAQSVAWALLVTAFMNSLFTPYGLTFVTWLNDKTRDLTTCVTFATMGGNCRDVSSNQTFEANVVETLATGAWGVGALGGDLANQAAPTTLHVTKSSDVPHFARDMDVHLPLAAIPAREQDKPTWAEVVRWTQTLTASDLAAIRADSSRACTLVGKGPTTNDITSDNPPTGMGICGDKWLVRAAVLSELRQNHPDAYDQLAGNGDVLGAAIGGVGVLPAAIGIGVIGAYLLIYELELVFYFLASPIAALGAVWNVQIARRWGDAIGATLVRRVAVGFVVGVVLWATGAVNEGIAALSTQWMLPPILETSAASLVTVAIMIVGYRLLGKVRDIFLTSVSLPEGESTFVEKTKAGGMRALELGVGAAAGALGAGSGMRLAGAWRGASRTNAFGGSLGRAMRAGDVAGMRLDQQREQQTRAGERDSGRREQHQDAVMTFGRQFERTMNDAANAIFNSPEAQAHRDIKLGLAEAGLQSWTEKLGNAEKALSDFDASPVERARQRDRANALIAEGLAPNDALSQALAESPERVALSAAVSQARGQVQVREAEVDGARNVARDNDSTVLRYRESLTQTMNSDPAGYRSEVSFADRVAAQEGVDSESVVRAPRSMEDAMRKQAELLYRGVNLDAAPAGR